MAMMMTGRVLLVCALCVLWCGADGLAEEGSGTTPPGASSSDGERLQETPPVVPGVSKNSVLKAPEAKDKKGELDKEILLKEEEAGSDEEDQDEDEDEGITPSGEEEIPPPPPGGGGGQSQAADEKLENVNESGPKPENQRQVESGTQNLSEKETVGAGEAAVTKQKEGSGPQPQDNPHPVQEEDTKSGEGHELTQEKEQQTNVEDMPPRNSAGDHSSGEHNGSDGSNEKEKEGEEGVEGHERHRAQEREEAAHVSGAPKVNSTDIQQEVQRTHAGETPTGIKQRAGEEKDDETEEEREKQNQEDPPGKEQETITGANATNQINTTPGDSDGSTAVSHTTSPLLLLLVVACAAAAAVVTA
ncbi:Mucin-associated surface protein (MASP) [Trypanosoma cruzi]|uniref:Mucin-associated surface protein (MASP), putative n=2 Tax=Trypanosoma cruzi TaxID=5693 RepID=Q4E380_TRYCC|nr:mucin-associated surface protein (MASP), putative [Trypanosoma cruzi]EAN99230.1 mucin-associated surface protein (MASP), putative [Trypanosoma cruzi]PWV17067.1 Mucin-associated surface protein (MASP) [Trypanosoma cruzi]RNC54524.1 mucin-associated surface protein (MASP) [Trypanosoma cruzi]|eukprot:XP_821081.1 mucin-associated surface protein (MASP) [Trypanosoma cruzi strain CL Brener]